MKTIIAGSRDFTDYDTVSRVIVSSGFEITEVVSSGASGVDACGECWAEDNGVDLKVFSADWEWYGRAAGPIRNEEMADYADALIAIYDSSKSKGTVNMIKQAKKKGLPMYVYDLKDDMATYRTAAVKLPIGGNNERN